MRPSVTLITIVYFLNVGLLALALPQRGSFPLSDIAARDYVDVPSDIDAREPTSALEKRFAGLIKGLFSLGKVIRNAIKGAKRLKHIKHIQHGIQNHQQQQQQQRPRRKHHRRRGLDPREEREQLLRLHSQIVRRMEIQKRQLDYQLELNTRRLEERHMDAGFDELD